MQESLGGIRGGRNLAIAVVLSLVMALGFVGQVAPANAAAASTIVKIVSVTTVGGGAPVVGESVLFAGRTTSNLKGKTLKLQILKSGKWTDIGISTSVKSNLTYAVKFSPSTAGSVQYRVIYVGSSTLKASYAAKTLTVWKWFSLSGQKIVASSASELISGPHYVAGKYYSSAFTNYYNRSAGSTGYAEFNISYKCSTFRGVAGMEDNSASGSSAIFAMKVDGSTRSQATINLGASQRYAVNTTGGFRIRLDYSVISGSGRPIWTNAAILCTSSPNSK